MFSSTCVIIGLIAGAFITGWTLGASKKEAENLAYIYRLKAEAAEQLQQQTDEHLMIERAYQAKMAQLDNKVKETQENSKGEIARLNAVIDSYRSAERVRDNSQSNHSTKPVSATPRITCSSVEARANRWRSAFNELAELAADLAVERDEIARIKNDLVSTYEGIRLDRAEREGAASEAE